MFKVYKYDLTAYEAPSLVASFSTRQEAETFCLRRNGGVYRYFVR